MLLPLLLACWNTTRTEEDPFGTVPFTNDYVSNPSGVVETIETRLLCPDGEAASFYVVYPENQVQALPVAIVLHSGAFDYVVSPTAEAPLVGQNYAGRLEDGSSRLEENWGVRKAWETLGLYPQVDYSESNLGTLPAALLDSGIVGIYPINCWGDLWHSDAQDAPNDRAAEFIDRNGGAFAYWMVRFLTDAQFASSQDLISQALVDHNSIYLVGLGDGARGVTELLRRDTLPAIQGVLIDSPIDDLEQWGAEIEAAQVGIDRLYYDPNGVEVNLANYSMVDVLEAGTLTDVRVSLVHSSFDPQVPAGNINPLLDAIGQDMDYNWCVIDEGVGEHVFTNGNLALAQEAVTFMVGGARPASCEAFTP